MSDHNNQPLGFYADNPDWTSPAAINDDLVARHESKSKYFKPIVLALGVGVILGVIGLIEPRIICEWSYCNKYCS